jgi:ATP-dependent DNA helicase RecG
MLEELLIKNEGKTLEFKENTKSLSSIIKTIIAFANTAGGTIVIGVEDKTKNIIGVSSPLDEEEKLANVISDSIAPLLVPEIEIQTYRNKELVIIHVYHTAGPFYLKTLSPEQGTYIRFGSTNRVADRDTLQSLKDFARNRYFDETPYLQGKINNLNWEIINNLFQKTNSKITPQKAENLGLTTQHANKDYPTFGGIILFGTNRLQLFPEAIIRCARFLGSDKLEILDQIDIEVYLPLAIEEAIIFIRRNTAMSAEFGELARADIPQYPPFAIREAIVNAVVHSDYSVKGIPISIAIFDNRIEITNPGGLPFGLTIEKAIAGASRIRNRVIGKVFYRLKWVEQWGMGLKRIIQSCIDRGLEKPKFEELNNQFKVTIYGVKKHKIALGPWEIVLVKYLKKHEKISTKEAALLWNVTGRTARLRLIKLIDEGIIQKTGTSLRDPKSGYILMANIDLED